MFIKMELILFYKADLAKFLKSLQLLLLTNKDYEMRKIV